MDLQHQCKELGPAPGRSESNAPLFEWNDEKIAEHVQSRLLDELLRVHEYERQRLGQELHDTTGQLLVALQLSVAHLRIVEGDSGHECLLDEMQDTIRHIDQEIRALAFLHYPAELGERCLCSAVQALALGFGKRTGIQVTFKCVGDPSAVDESTSMAMLRVAQEALVNIHRHSHAASARVVLERQPERLQLTVTDDGVGICDFDLPTKVKGIGLDGMRHRVETLGGRFRVSTLKRGTKVFASVPVAA